LSSFKLEFNTYVETESAAAWVDIQLTELSIEVITIGTTLRVDVSVALMGPSKHVVAEQGQVDVAQVEFAHQRLGQAVLQSDVTQFDIRPVKEIRLTALSPSILVVIILIAGVVQINRLVVLHILGSIGRTYIHYGVGDDERATLVVQGHLTVTGELHQVLRA
jgi:hypothetical protein